jgi:thiol:disulfide interchange protein
MRKAVCTILFVMACLSLQAAHTHARLLLGAKSAKPGETIVAGVQLKMDSGWHTYWKNSGAAGMPTKVDWDLSAGISAGALQWPVPEKLPEQDLTTYIYRNEVVLLIPLTVDSNAKPGELRIKAKVSWLECAVQCVPGDAELEGTLTIASETTPSDELALLEVAKQKLPQKAPATLMARALWDGPPREKLRPLILEWHSVSPEANADFYPYSSDQFEVQPETERVASDPDRIRLLKRVKTLTGGWPPTISGLLIEEGRGTRRGYEIDLPIAAPGPSLAASSAAAGAALWKILMYAFLGGLILNVMPCVLPVIALKILGFVGQARQEPGRVRALGLVYGLGVMASFLALAGLVLAVRAAGHRAGWGMQFGNPQFLVALTVLMTLVALNLFGLFEVTPGARVMDAAGTLASKHGPAGAFFNGVLATVLATPCTAPFLGAALGFAFTQSAAYVLLIFVVVALGLAAPYVVLSWNPAWLRFVPKPGRWMERFKVAMGFPMLATAVWLFSLIPTHYGARSWWLVIFLVVVACAAWVYGEFYQRATSRRGVGLAAALLLVLVGYAYVVEGQLQWRSPVREASGGSTPLSRSGIPWERWTPAAVAKAREEGRPVLVDFTADWCLTCQANKKFALEVPQVRAKLKEINALPLLGDYTRLPDDITAELNRYGRAGVPLVLVYPKNSAEPAIVLPEALTRGIVLDALDKAAQ